MAAHIGKTGEGASGAFAPLREPTFRRVWTASLFSSFSQLILGVGAAWEMTRLTNSPNMVALVQTAMMLPLMLVALPAGAVADMFDRRRIALGWPRLFGGFGGGADGAHLPGLRIALGAAAVLRPDRHRHRALRAVVAGVDRRAGIRGTLACRGGAGDDKLQRRAQLRPGDWRSCRAGLRRAGGIRHYCRVLYPAVAGVLRLESPARAFAPAARADRSGDRLGRALCAPFASRSAR